MEYRDLEDLSNEIRRRYDENPTGWRTFRDKKNNILVIGPDKGYRLKLVPLSPWKHIGVGLSMERDKALDQLRGRTPASGLRALSKNDFERLVTSTNREGGSQMRVIKKLLDRKPVSTQDLREEGSQAVLTGPVVSHPDLSTLSEKQKELQEELKYEAERLFRKKYPQRAGLYR
ncbi:MAG: hypothetical protein ACLFVP_01165 [Candidatus Bathyarchaeia archaeon]